LPVRVREGRLARTLHAGNGGPVGCVRGLRYPEGGDLGGGSDGDAAEVSEAG